MQSVAALFSAPAAPPTRPELVFQVLTGSHASLETRNMSDLHGSPARARLDERVTTPCATAAARDMVEVHLHRVCM